MSLKAIDLIPALSLVQRFGVVHLIVEDGRIFLSIESEVPYALTVAEMSLLHQLGWRYDGWLERWENVQ